MKKVIFGITGLTLGGAERVLVDLANELSKKYDITIFTIYAGGELEKELNDKVKLKSIYDVSYKQLSKIQKLTIPLKLLFRKNKIYKKYIKENYDVEIAFLEGPITRLFSVKNDKVNKIAWIHNDISFVFGDGFKAKLKRKIDNKIYSKYKTLIFVSKENLNNFNKTYPNIKVDKKVIYNYINKDNIIRKANRYEPNEIDVNNKNFLTVARLVSQKGIDRIIEVHSKLIRQGLKHYFYVIGDGSEKEKLEKLIKENNVEETFILLGKKENPYPYIKKIEYFCLFSKFEGYGMVLEEAKILNKNILITNTAAREAVEGYNKAIITENTEDGIYNVMKEKIEEEKQNENHKQEIDNGEKIIKEIITLIESGE